MKYMGAVLVLTCGTACAQTPRFTLTSPAVGQDGKYPVEFTCDGESASPPLAWSNAPAGTRSYVVTMHHIPPGGEDKHVYMLVYNLPASVTSLAKNSRAGLWGVNTVNRRPGYAPPCSKGPGDKTYTLTVYALSSEPDLQFPHGPVTMDTLLASIRDSILAASAMEVTYARQGNGEGRGAAPPPGRGQPLEQAVESLHLTSEQQQKVRDLLQSYSDKQRQLRDELMLRLKGILDREQYQKIEKAARP